MKFEPHNQILTRGLDVAVARLYVYREDQNAYVVECLESESLPTLLRFRLRILRVLAGEARVSEFVCEAVKGIYRYDGM